MPCQRKEREKNRKQGSEVIKEYNGLYIVSRYLDLQIDIWCLKSLPRYLTADL
jgi:hypothetical protein